MANVSVLSSRRSGQHPFHTSVCLSGLHPCVSRHSRLDGLTGHTHQSIHPSIHPPSTRPISPPVCQPVLSRPSHRRVSIIFCRDTPPTDQVIHPSIHPSMQHAHARRKSASVPVCVASLSSSAAIHTPQNKPSIQPSNHQHTWQNNAESEQEYTSVYLTDTHAPLPLSAMTSPTHDVLAASSGRKEPLPAPAGHAHTHTKTGLTPN